MLLAGHLEGYLNDLTGEICDALPSKWDAAIVPKKIVVAQAVLDDLSRAFSALDATAPNDEAALDAIKVEVERVSSYFSQPNTVKPRRLEGYYRSGGARSVEQLITKLNPPGPKLFEWAEAIGSDRSRMWTTLNAVSSDRSQIAHGNLTTNSTPNDARGAVCVVAATVRRIERYCDQYKLL